MKLTRFFILLSTVMVIAVAANAQTASGPPSPSTPPVVTPTPTPTPVATPTPTPTPILVPTPVTQTTTPTNVIEGAACSLHMAQAGLLPMQVNGYLMLVITWMFGAMLIKRNK